jgi:hypothetical protein
MATSSFVAAKFDITKDITPASAIQEQTYNNLDCRHGSVLNEKSSSRRGVTKIETRIILFVINELPLKPVISAGFSWFLFP